MKSKSAEKRERHEAKQRVDIVNWAKSLTDKQLVEFFYEVVEDRNIYAEGPSLKQRMVIALATSYLNDDGEYDPYELNVIAMHDKEDAPFGWIDEASICQSGYSSCGKPVISITSWAKSAICPICGEKVSLT